MNTYTSCRKAVGATLVSISVIASLAACSSGSTSSSGSSTAAQGDASTTESATQTDAAGEFFSMLPEEIQEAGTITIGTEAYYPPYEYLDTDGTTIVGFDPDLLEAVTERLGIEYTLENVAFDTLLPSLDAGRYDVIVAAMTDNAERQENYDFVDYFLAGQAIIVPAGNPNGYTVLSDLCGATVAVLKDSAQETILEDLNTGDCSADPVEILSQASDTDALLQVQGGRADASFSQEATGRYNASQVSGGTVFEVANTETIDPKPLGYVFSKGDTELEEAFQAALQSLVDDGTYAEILDSYEIGSGALDTITINAGE